MSDDEQRAETAEASGEAFGMTVTTRTGDVELLLDGLGRIDVRRSYTVMWLEPNAPHDFESWDVLVPREDPRYAIVIKHSMWTDHYEPYETSQTICWWRAPLAIVEPPKHLDGGDPAAARDWLFEGVCDHSDIRRPEPECTNGLRAVTVAELPKHVFVAMAKAAARRAEGSRGDLSLEGDPSAAREGYKSWDSDGTDYYTTTYQLDWPAVASGRHTTLTFQLQLSGCSHPEYGDFSTNAPDDLSVEVWLDLGEATGNPSLAGGSSRVFLGRERLSAVLDESELGVFY
jgi:hypothetical protein